MKEIGYRFRQFWSALTATPDSRTLSEINEILLPQLMALFLQLQPSEQEHSLQIYRKMHDAGWTDKDLLVAALLHDVGKIKYPLKLWQRVEIVVLKRIAPETVKAWGQSISSGWRQPFVVAAQHPGWGAEMAEKAGASPLSVLLIKKHQDHLVSHDKSLSDSQYHFLKLLQTYDDES